MNQDAWPYDSIELQINFTKKTNWMVISRLIVQDSKRLKQDNQVSWFWFPSRRTFTPQKNAIFSNSSFPCWLVEMDKQKVCRRRQMKWWTKEEQDHPFSPLRTSPTNRGSFKTLTPLRLERKKKDKINHLSLLSPKKRKKEFKFALIWPTLVP